MAVGYAAVLILITAP